MYNSYNKSKQTVYIDILSSNNNNKRYLTFYCYTLGLVKVQITSGRCGYVNSKRHSNIIIDEIFITALIYTQKRYNVKKSFVIKRELPVRLNLINGISHDNHDIYNNISSLYHDIGMWIPKRIRVYINTYNNNLFVRKRFDILIKRKLKVVRLSSSIRIPYNGTKLKKQRRT